MEERILNTGVVNGDLMESLRYNFRVIKDESNIECECCGKGKGADCRDRNLVERLFLDPSAPQCLIIAPRAKE